MTKCKYSDSNVRLRVKRIRAVKDFLSEIKSIFALEDLASCFIALLILGVLMFFIFAIMTSFNSIGV